MIDPLSQQTQYTYDASGNRLTQVDADNHTTTYVWDPLNRRTSRQLPAGQTESLTYDPVGNIVTRVDFNGKTTTFAYDALNRRLSRTPDASFGAAPITFTYTLTGQRATMNDPNGLTTYTYTNRDQVASKATPQGTLAYTYDLSGNVASVVSSNANGTNVTYAWDADNRSQSVMDNGNGGTSVFTYDATSQLSSMLYPNGVTHAYSYDTRDRLTTLNVNGSGGTLAGYTQTYSPSGRKLTVAEGTGRSENYGYDSTYRLVNENISGDPTAANNGSLSYTLDPVGNRLSMASTLAALRSQGFTYDSNDRINTDTHDANGNTTSSDGVNYTYDFEDRLLTASNGVQIIYDGDGNRVSETTGGVTTKYLVDNLTPTGFTQVAEETVNGAVVAQFTYGRLRISQLRSGTLSFYSYDGGENVRQLANVTGALTDTYAFDAYGAVSSHTGSTVNPYQYRGEAFDPGLGAYYLRARYYEPVIGRFETQDRLEGHPEFPKTLNKYTYAISDPVDHSDPTGNEVAISYGITANNEGSGSVIGAAQQAFTSTCLLSPALSILTIIANGTLAQYPLGTYPIVSACGGGAAFSGNMPIPGDCNWIQYAILAASVTLVCHDRNDLYQEACIPGVDDKATCAVKAQRLSACIVARVLRDATCFRGGNASHRAFTATLIGYFEGCQAAWAIAKN